MTEPNQILRAGFEDLVPVLIFVAFAVISQLIKRAQRQGAEGAGAGTRKAPPPRPHSPTPRQQQAPRSPLQPADEELRKFLEELSGASLPEPQPVRRAPPQQRRTAPPPPPPVPKARPPERAAARAALSKAGKRKPVPARGEHPRVHKPEPPAGVAEVAPLPDWGRRQKTPEAIAALRGGLKGRASLRDAILLREVLGPPLALRGGNLPRK